MKFRYLLVVLTYFTTPAFAQNGVYLENNNSRAYLSGQGTLFLNNTPNAPHYEIPKDSYINAINSLSFWYAGKDGSGQLRFAAGGSDFQGTDVFNGPVSNPAVYYDSAYIQKWSKAVWSICQEDIDQYDLFWRCNNIPNTPGCGQASTPSGAVLEALNAWPANGNVSLGQSAKLAPFFDRNNDGVYNIADGDLPLIKGCCATYMIQNDLAAPHTYTNSDPIGLEVHYLIYQYATWDYLNDVTFIDVLAINKGTNIFTEFNHSLVVDADLGNFDDDYMGCDSTSNTLFFYNGDNTDETTALNNGYGNNPPAIGIVALQNNIQSALPFTSAGSTLSEKWNLMNGLMLNGAPVTHPSGYSTKYFYSGNPNNASEWSEYTENTVPGDRRGLCSMNVGSFNPGDTLRQSYAITYERSGNHIENVQEVLDISTLVKNFFEDDSNTPCEGRTWGLSEEKPLLFDVYPNPSQGEIYVQTSEAMIKKILIYNATGQLVLETTPNSNFERVNLNESTPGIYFLHLTTSAGSDIKKIILE